MSVKTRKPVYIQNIRSSVGDSDNSASLIDRIAYSSNNEKDLLILRGLEAGPGISIHVVDFDDNKFNTKEKKVVIALEGYDPSPDPDPDPPDVGEEVSAGTYYNPTITINEDGRISDIKNGVALEFIGEINTAGNIGNGFPIFSHKKDKQLMFKTIIPGEGVDIQEFGDSIIISAPNNSTFSNSTGSCDINIGGKGNACLSNTGLTKEFIKEECTVIIPEDHQIMVYGTYKVEGKLINQGRLVIL